MISVLYANRILDVLFRGSGYPGGTVWVALHSGDPEAGGAEISGTGFFDRPNLDWYSWHDAAGGVIQTSVPVSMNSLRAATAQYLALWNHRRVGLGSLLHSSPLPAPLEIAEGQTVTFAAGAIQVSLVPCGEAGNTQMGEVAANKLLTYVFRGGIHNDYSRNYRPSPVSLSLHSDDPGLTGLHEVSGRSYHRHPAPPDYWSGPSGRTIALNADIDWPDIPTSTITHIGIWDALGNFAMGIRLPNPVTWLAGYMARLKAGQLRVTLGCAAPSLAPDGFYGDVRLWVRTAIVGGPTVGYVLIMKFHNAGSVLPNFIGLFQNGTVPIDKGGDLPRLADGDVIKLRCETVGSGVRFKIYQNGVLRLTSETIDSTDDRFIADGRAGVMVANDLVNVPMTDVGQYAGYIQIDDVAITGDLGTFTDHFNRPDEAPSSGLSGYQSVPTDGKFAIRSQRLTGMQNAACKALIPDAIMSAPVGTDHSVEFKIFKPTGPPAGGGTGVALPTISSGAATFAPRLAGLLSLSAIGSGAALQSPVVGYAVSAPTIGSGAATYGPTLAYAVSASNISTSATFNVPSVTGSGDEETMRLAEGRLTLQSGSPVATADQIGKSNIYFSPFMGNRLALYSGGAWATFSFSEFFVALSGLTSGKLYDVFAYDNAGTPAMEVGPVWTNDTTRATALSLQDGVLVKSGDATRRYLGTFRTTGTTTTEDSQGGTTGQLGGKRFLWNYYNRIQRKLAVYDFTGSWTYASATVRQANGNAGNKIEWVTGLAEDLIDALLFVTIQSATSASATVGFGLDSTTVFNTDTQRFQIGGGAIQVNMHGSRHLGMYTGYHSLVWLEAVPGASTTTFVGSNSSSTNNGIQAILKA